jgi:hypothetical protein
MNYLLKAALMAMVLLGLDLPTLSHAKEAKHPSPKAKGIQTAATKPPSDSVKIDSKAEGDDYIAVSSTKIDFTETAIDGKMKAPEGFLLQSRQSNSMSQMVKLRSNFRNELNNSKSAIKSLVK